MITEQVKDKILGLIFGQALADAYGLATEFMTKDEIKDVYPESEIPFYHYQRNDHNRRWKRGSWTDDSDQMICIMDSFSSFKAVNHLDFAKRLFNWMKHGHPELNAKVGMGIGNLTLNVLNHPEFLYNPHKAAHQVNLRLNSEANGAIMRTCIVGAIDFNDQNKVKENTLKLAAVTHAGILAQASCIFATTIISEMLKSESVSIPELKAKAIADGLHFLKSCMASQFQLDEWQYYTQDLQLEDVEWDGPKLGYALFCVQAVIFGLNNEVATSDDFKRVVQQLILQGGDCDSTGSVLGGVLGCKIGYSNLPQDWIQLMPHSDVLMSKALRFIDSLSA